MTQELTTTEIKAKIRLFAWPITLSMLVAQLYSVIDMAVIGRFLGANELAAVGNAANVIMVFLAISGGLEMAVEIIVSQLIGQKNQDSFGHLLFARCISPDQRPGQPDALRFDLRQNLSGRSFSDSRL